MKKKLLAAAFALALLTLLGWAFMPEAVQVEVAAVRLGRFERAVQEDGKTRVRERYLVSSPLTGRVARIAWKQGDMVQRDAELATLWPADPALLDARSRAGLNARVGAMQASLARARANAGRAATALEQAKSELLRSEALARQGFVSPNQNETGRMNVRLREKELESARQEEQAAKHELEQARIALQQFVDDRADGKRSRQRQADLAKRPYVVRAPVSGRVLKVLQQSEAIVTTGTPLIELGDPAQLEVVVDILTEDAAQIWPGTPVQLLNWGGPDKLDGRVRLVEPAAFTKISALGVEEQRVYAIIDITAPAAQWQSLGDGFKVDVRVLVQVVEQALMVPVSALFPAGARSALFVLEQEHIRQREIEVAARNGVDAWIRPGQEGLLRADMKVVIYPDSKLKDGDAVKPR